MQAFDHSSHRRPTSAFVRRRLAEATLSQDEHDDASWRLLDPGPSAVTSLSQSAQSLHDGLQDNAVQHVEQYMDAETYSLTFSKPEIWTPEMESRPDLSAAHIPFDPLMDEGYMVRPSASEASQKAATEIGGMSFEKQAVTTAAAPSPKQQATITYYADCDSLSSLNIADFEEMSERCPLLGMAFEDSRSGPRLFLETLSSRTAQPFSRYLNTGSYAEPSEEWNGGGRFEDVPTSLLLHCEMYRLGDIHDLIDMKSQAYVNVLRQCEFGCSSPDKPIDLCSAIRFVYDHLGKQEQIIDAIVNYCVACFSCHHLAEDADFKQLAYDLRPFHQDLCKNCMSRGFENETAAAIIQMPFEPHRPETYASTEHRHSFHDVVFHTHALEEVYSSPKKRKRPCREFSLAMRSVKDAITHIKAEPESEEDDDIATEGNGPASSVECHDNDLLLAGVEDDIEGVDLGPAAKNDTYSDAESFEWVYVAPKGIELNKASKETIELPVRVREQTPVGHVKENDSDSDWSLV